MANLHPAECAADRQGQSEDERGVRREGVHQSGGWIREDGESAVGQF